VLDERIGRDLRQIYNRLDREGKLLSQAQLSGYYETFRQRFGPDKLVNLDGEVLLKKIHGPGKDSLVYWLEFKNDEEFPAKFGSISGGSALKFGIYYRSETQAWMTGSSIKQQEITLEEAIAQARRHRDQLIRGAEIVDGLPADETDEDYRMLQESMDAETPEVGDSA